MSSSSCQSFNNICADCSYPEPQWASINRGVLICDDCCDIHRSLGRHISQVKSINRSIWPPTQLTMVYQLVEAGSNNIWEYTLVGSNNTSHKQNKRKPTPSDSMHPNKADFIKAKYQNLAYVNKQKDVDCGAIDDLSQQLHSAVRTSNLETSLRLLSFGADPCYFHPDKGNCALHIAAKEGQASQVELLIVYGADPGAFDTNGYTPCEYARNQGHNELANRIVACQYALTDRLTYYLCGRTPAHTSGQHFLVPDLQSQGARDPASLTDAAVELDQARKAKLRLMDLSNRLFEELAMDVYDEIDRRENENIWKSVGKSSSTIVTQMTVPFLPMNPQFSATRNQARQKLAVFKSVEFSPLIADLLSEAKRRQNVQIYSMNHKASDSGFLSDQLIGEEDPVYDSVAGEEDYASIGNKQPMDDSFSFTAGENVCMKDLKCALMDSKTQISDLLLSNNQMKEEIMLLHNMVRKLETKGIHDDTVPLRRPQSMFESINSIPKRISKSASDDTSYSSIMSSSNSTTISEDCELTTQKRPSSRDLSDQKINLETVTPTHSQVVAKTVSITQNISSLLEQVHNPDIKTYAKCSQNISKAIEDMATLFPQPELLEYPKRESLNTLMSCAAELNQAVNAVDVDEEETTAKVIYTAKNIVLATKNIVMLL